VSMCLTLRRLYVEEMESIRDTVAVWSKKNIFHVHHAMHLNVIRQIHNN
jgi:hypothetical protein